jgi:hypothetical protein
MNGGSYSIALWSAGGAGADGHGLLYFAGSPSSWSLATIDATCCATGGPSLRLNAGGLARVAYPDGSMGSPTGLRFAKRSPAGSWSIENVDSHPSEWPELAYNEDNKPVIVYVHKGIGTFVTTSGPSGWTHSQVGHGYVDPPDIALWGSGISGNSAIIVGKSGVIAIYTASTSVAYHYNLVATGNDSNGEIEQYGGKLRVIFNRSSGGTGDGIYYTKEN